VGEGLAPRQGATYKPRMTNLVVISMAAFAALASRSAVAAAPKPVTVQMNFIDASGIGKSAGTVMITETPGGLELATNLKGLPPGEHGFHLHEKGSCAPADKEGKPSPGESAGGHYDPEGTKAHRGPGGGGHKGDLPKLAVNPDGVANQKLTVPGLKLADVAGRALVIHEGGDNYSDTPKPLGGGGTRIACGVIGAPLGAGEIGGK